MQLVPYINNLVCEIMLSIVDFSLQQHSYNFQQLSLGKL